MKQKEFKTKMPTCAEWVDALCAAFGTEEIHGQIRAGLNGAPTFHASENGQEIGTRIERGQAVGWHPETGCAMSLDKGDGQ